jgi:hypothetical protein
MVGGGCDPSVPLLSPLNQCVEMLDRHGKQMLAPGTTGRVLTRITEKDQSLVRRSGAFSAAQRDAISRPVRGRAFPIEALTERTMASSRSTAWQGIGWPVHSLAKFLFETPRFLVVNGGNRVDD